MVTHNPFSYNSVDTNIECRLVRKTESFTINKCSVEEFFSSRLIWYLFVKAKGEIFILLLSNYISIAKFFRFNVNYTTRLNSVNGFWNVI